MVDIVEQVLETLGRKTASNPAVAYYSYRKHFREIWQLLDRKDRHPIKHLFIVWDGVPELSGGLDIGIRDFLTVYDWAAALALKAAQAQLDDSSLHPFDFRLHVLPMTPADELPLSLAARVAPFLRDIIFPWMEIYPQYKSGPFVSAAEQAVSDLQGETLLQFLSDPRRKGSQATEFIQNLWTSELTKAGVRHSISNAIGPAALAQCLKSSRFSAADSILAEWLEGEDSLRSTFWHFLEILGLLPHLEKGAFVKEPQGALGGLADKPLVQENLFGQFNNIRFALVDDQAGAGFHEALSAFLLGHDMVRGRSPTHRPPAAPVAISHSQDGRLTLSSFSRPEMLLDWLLSTAERSPAAASHRPPFGRRSLYAERSLPPVSMSEFDVLFLDLRLHGISGAASERDNETTWVSKLLGFLETGLKKIISTHGVNPAQQQALDVATHAAERRLAGERTDEAIVGQLALLPIMISICDPTVPIVLFSSTRHRAVIELFRPFPNIITSFAKPAITGYGEEDLIALESVVPSLERALSEALEIHEKRCLWDLVAQFELKEAVPPPCILPAPETPDMPFIGSRYLANVRGRRDLPFCVNDWYTKRLRSMIADYVVGKEDVDHIYKPYEFLESCLNSMHQLRRDSKLDMQFQPPAFNEFVRAKIIDRVPARALAIEHIKKARHKVVHGSVGSKPIDPVIVKYVGLIVLIKFLFGIHNKSLRAKLDILYLASNPLIRTVTTGHFNREDLTINRPESKGPLARSVVAYANEIWPWTDNRAAAGFMASLGGDT